MAEDQTKEDSKEPKEPKEEKEQKEEGKEEQKDTDKPEESVEKEEPDKPEEPPELLKEDIIKILKTFPGVGQVMAERIYDSGIDSREKLASVSVDALKELPGIGQAMAENIANGMKEAIKEFDEPEKKEKAAAKPGPGITTKAIGFVKGTISKITGFFKGKQPKPKSELEKKPEPGKKPDEDTKTIGEGVGEPRKTELAIAKPDEEKAEEAIKETYYPEVGKSAEETAHEPVHEKVTVEAGEPESKPEQQLEPAPEPETTPAIEPSSETSDVKEPERESVASVEPTPQQPKFEINFKNSSGLLIWFETTPNLRSDAGKILFKAGYNNLDELKDAVVDDLLLVKGIGHDEAKTICQEIQRLN